jgi:ABC-type multidrug transport system ATPase subunit
LSDNGVDSSRVLLDFNTEQEFSDYVNSKDYGLPNTPSEKVFYAGVLLEDLLGPQYSYTIRMNCTTSRKGYNYYAVPPTTKPPVDKLRRSYSGTWEGLFLARGFSALQSVVDTFILHRAGALKFENEAAITAARVDDHLKVYLQPFPTPAYTRDDFASLVSTYLGLFLTLVFIWPVTRIVAAVVEEKELRIKMGMKMMGLKEAALVGSWAVTYCSMFAVTCALITAATCANIYKYSSAALIFLFYFAFCLCVFAFAFFLSALFDRARTGSTFSAIIFLVLFFLYYVVEAEDVARASKLLAALSPSVCLALGAAAIAQMESAGVGASAGNVGVVIGNWSLADSLVMFAVDAGLYFALALYVNEVFPGEFGVPRPWYFFLTASFWCPRGPAGEDGAHTHLLPSSASLSHLPLANEPGTLMEAPLADEAPVVQLRGLRKTFPAPGRDFVAVKGLSLDMYKGQIFCLLGENGAGKSTTINMLTGLYPPSAGSASVNGHDIAADPAAVCAQQGVCMQHDILYPYLSVVEHLELYAAIKGVPAAEREAEIRDMVEKVGLGASGDNKMNALAGTLSGGQMRKLSVGIALLNKPAVVYLDEPSSGMDVASQRHIWDLIIAQKRERVVVLTSHSMGEVESLGDTVGIMAGGRLICLGSQRYLKDQYGVGYTLTISKVPTNQADRVDRAQLHPGTATLSGSKIAKFMQDRYPFAQLTSDAGGEISFRMPFSASAGFPDMFDDLEARKQGLALTTFGVSVTTMTEVFLKVVAAESREARDDEALAQAEDEAGAVSLKASASEDEDEEWGATGGARVDSKCTLFRLHFAALFAKRVQHARRDRKQWAWSLLYPGIIMLVSLLSLTFAIKAAFPQRLTGAALYDAPNDFSFVASADPVVADLYSYLEQPNGGGQQGLGVTPLQLDAALFPEGAGPAAFNAYLLDSVVDRPVDRLRTGAFNVNATANFPPSGPVTSDADVATIEAQLYFNTTAQEAMPAYMNLLHTLLLRAGTGDDTASITTNNHPFDKTAKLLALTTASLAFSLAIAFCFVSATYAGFLVKERADKVKHLQVVSGVSPAAYWLANYAWDILNFALPFAMMMALLFAFDVTVLVDESLGAVVLVSWLFALAAAPFVYCLSFLFESHVAAQNSTLLLNFISSVVLLTLIIVMTVMESTRDIARNLRFLFRLLPPFVLGDALSFIMIKDSIYPGAGLWDLDIVGYDMLFLVFDAVLYAVLLLLLEHWDSSNTLDWLRGGCGRGGAQAAALSDDDCADADAEEDGDVRAERERIERGECDDTGVFSVVLKGLRKVYPSRMGAKPHVAVSNLFFSVKKGECLGFLGANGAGKSTTMKMLTGDVYPSEGSGTALMGGLDLLKEPYEVRRLIGYCPQFDALLPLMTGREHLYLFARIKCVPAEKLDGFVSYMIRKLGLVHLADKPAGTYSGGNRRKLCVGIALIGNPSIVFLDEPSTGVDPQSRRFMWNLISSTMRHRSVILTTHALDEAEALADRITIITSGKLRALGTSQELKEKFGNNFQVSARSLPGRQQDVISFFQQRFPGTAVIEAHTVNLKLRVPKAGASLAHVFRVVEEHKREAGIDAYSVSGTDLEQIFINFVKQDVQRNVQRNVQRTETLPEGTLQQ